MRQIIYTFGFMGSVLFAATGTVTISSPTKGADIYVDGKKMATIVKVPVTLSLDEGRHEVMVSKIMDEDWQQVARKNVNVESAKTTPLIFSLDLEKISKKKNTGQRDNFIKDGDVVIDKKLNLVWQDNTAVIKVKKTWEEAKAYCQSLSLSYSDSWRLPTYDELITIVDYDKHTLAAMPAFKHVVSEYYWSSDTDKENSKNAKNIYFGNGCPSSNAKAERYYIRCVRNK